MTAPALSERDLAVLRSFARRIDPADAGAHNNLGVLYYHKGLVAEAIETTVLRPLVGMDKREIMDYAQREGTYAISIVPDEDCCSLFVPRHPATAAARAEVEEAERGYDVGGLVRSAVEAREREVVEPAWRSSAVDLAAEIA